MTSTLSSNYSALVLEGGGPKGFEYWGLADCLEKHGILPKINFFAGSSIGALFSMIFALKIPAKSIGTLVMETDFAKLVNGKVNLRIVEALDVLLHLGINSGSKLEHFVKKVISLAYDKPPETLTFAGLKEHTGNVLMVTCTNLNECRGKYFSPMHTPNEPVFAWVHASMSFPGAFEPVQRNNDLWADGGIYDNFPIRETLKYLPIVHPEGWGPVLGVKFVTPDDTTASGSTVYHCRKPIKNVLDLGIAIVTTMQNSRENTDLTPDFWDHTIALYTGNMSIFDESFTPEQKQKFHDDAYRDTTAFLEKHGVHAAM